jgi:hypothetical protein
MWYSESFGLLKTPRAVTVADVQHPANIFRLWSKADLAAIGFKPARMASADSRYNNLGGETYALDGSTDEWVISYTETPKSVADLKANMKESVSSLAQGALLGSDWMSIRESDGGTAMPADWKTYRAAVRTTSNAKEIEIDALADMDAVKAYEAHPVTYTRKTYDDAAETWGAPNVTSNTTVNKVTWGEEGGHADSWPVAPDRVADPSFVSVANT